MDNIFQYVPYKSFVDSNFWFKFAQIKIDIDCLSVKPRRLFGNYTNLNAKDCILEVDCTSFNETYIPAKNTFISHGAILNKNTIEDFKNCDKSELLQQEGRRIWNTIKTGSYLQDPSLLSNFFILSFADIKIFKFYYWFCFPAPAKPLVHTKSTQLLVDALSPAKFEEFQKIFCDAAKVKSYYLVEDSKDSVQYYELKNKISHDALETNFAEDEQIQQTYFCFSDPSEYDNPGWNLRLYMAAIYYSCPKLHGKIIKLVAIRLKSTSSIENSLLYEILLPETSDGITDKDINWIGWEQNESGKMTPRVADMRPTMDPVLQAKNSVNLNLKLMKWRLLPELNLEVIENTKCLLLGAGTLGCGVARTLLGWGVHKLTVLDAGHVSHANPVRQNLYTHQDAVECRRKVDALKDRIKDIHPGVEVETHHFFIPMPGHPVGESTMQSTIENINKIKDLIQENDVIFMLTDSRESRWLPTLLGAYYNKLVINTALGFDSYVVMRHGSRSPDAEVPVKTQPLIIDGLKCIPGNRLGCYFCNDITAPGDSQKDRTLDQQCTVTRPSVSNIASSFAVELMVALLQHPDRQYAPAYYALRGNQEMNSLIPEGIMGILPHSIRGIVSNFQQIIPATEHFNQCTACSDIVLKEFKSRGNDFIIDVLNSAKSLERLTGISDMHLHEIDIIEVDDDEEFDVSD